MIANFVAVDIRDWIRLYKIKSSHTNSAQWMLIDYNKLPSVLTARSLKPDTVVVFEHLGDSYLNVDVSKLISEVG